MKGARHPLWLATLLLPALLALIGCNNDERHTREAQARIRAAALARLSFDLASEYKTAMAAIEGTNDNAKSKASDARRAGWRLVRERATNADREAIFEYYLNCGTTADLEGSELPDLRDDLLHLFAMNGDREKVVTLLSQKPVNGGYTGLCAELHFYRFTGTIPDGAGVVFEAYDKGTESARAVIEQDIDWAFRYLFDQHAVRPPDRVAWARSWYRNRADLIVENSDIGPGGPLSAYEASCFESVEESFVKTLGVAPLWYTTCEVSHFFSDWSTDDSYRLWSTDRRTRTERSRAQVSQTLPWFVACISEPRPDEPRSLLCAHDGTVRILAQWQDNSEHPIRTAIVPARFEMAWGHRPIFIGEPWQDGPLNDFKGVRIRYLPRESVSRERVADAIVAAQDLQLEPLTEIRLYPTAAHLQFSISPLEPPDTDAWGATDEDGMFLKIVANSATPTEVIIDRLKRAMVKAAHNPWLADEPQ